MKLITIGDIFDTYVKIKQQGFSFIFSKNGLNKTKRIIKNWNENKNISGFHHIPYLIEHQNKLITGDKNISYPKYFCKKYLANNQKYKMLSVGCGTGFYEREFYKEGYFSKIVGIELSANRVKEAEELASKSNFNITYLNKNFYDIDFNEKFDVILFNASLHHFENIETLLSNYIKALLKSDGYLIVCEYVGKNRLHIPDFQLKEINKLLLIMRLKYRKYLAIRYYKNKVYSPGIIRMKLNDPSEAVDSEAILPTLHKYFKILEETQLGFNLLMPLLRGIAHNFINMDNEAKQILDTLIEADVNFTTKNKISDFIFGVYQ